MSNIKTKKNNFSKPEKKVPANKNNKIKPITYRKKFDTFAEAAEELYQIPSINLIDYPTTVDAVNRLMVRLFEYPDIESGINRFSQISISLDKAFIKTNKFYGFGYTIDKSFEGKGFKINSVELIYTSYNNMKTVDDINYLNEKGWTTEK